MDNFCTIVTNSGCDYIFKPLLIPAEDLKGPSLTNPSVLVVDGKILVNIRNVNYTLYHSEKNVFEHKWGPLSYIHPENDLTLTTNNILCELNDDLNIINYNFVDTSLLDVPPKWEFVGLEDCRLINWEDKIILCGVRRDTTQNGVGRMEYSHLSIEKDSVSETYRHRIPAPGKDDSYCEKNWMPILDKPNHFIKWSNPVEVVEVVKSETKTVHLGNYVEYDRDWRGGSQVVKFDGFYVSIVHETNLFKSEAGGKNAIYKHRFIVRNDQYQVVMKSDAFSFLGMSIEFCCGLAIKGDDLLVTFGAQDNSAYIMRFPKSVMWSIVK